MKEKQNYVTFKYIYVDIAKDVETRFDWINERWIRWKNNDRLCHIDTKNTELFNRRHK